MGGNDIIVDGRAVSVSRRGTGREVLLLHGYMSCKESFYYQSEALAAAHFRAVAPDFPGFGRSQTLDEAWSVCDYADWLISFMDAEGIKRPSVVAHSFGARVALCAFSRHGERVDRLIIVGGAGIVRQRSPQYMRRVKAYRAVKKLFPKFAERHFGSGEYRALPPIMRESYKKIVNTDLRTVAAGIEAPTLLVYGEDDCVTPYSEEGVIFRSAISKSRLVKMQGGHFCFSEHAEIFNPLMLGFLRENN